MTQSKPAPEADLITLRHEYLQALVVLDRASQRLHQALDNAAIALTTVRDHIQAGGAVSDFIGRIQPMPLRTELSTATDTLERARHHAQRLLFKILHSEGTSMSDIARTWGISRQLVSRLINEPEQPITALLRV